MHYQVIFDITQTRFSHWAPLVFALVAANRLHRILFPKLPAREAFGFAHFLGVYFGDCVLTIVPILLFVFTWTNYFSLRSALQESQCKIVEGAVSNLRQGSFWGNGGEKGFGEIFLVDGVEFRYRSEGGMDNGFHKAGVIQQGMKVRIHYCDRGNFSKDIARLEIAP